MSLILKEFSNIDNYCIIKDNETESWITGLLHNGHCMLATCESCMITNGIFEVVTKHHVICHNCGYHYKTTGF